MRPAAHTLVVAGAWQCSMMERWVRKEQMAGSFGRMVVSTQDAASGLASTIRRRIRGTILIKSYKIL